MEPEISERAAVYAAAILAVSTTNPNRVELGIIQALGLDLIEERHIAFAAYCRRTAEGEQDVEHYTDLARAFGELGDAWEAVEWLRGRGDEQRRQRAARH